MIPTLSTPSENNNQEKYKDNTSVAQAYSRVFQKRPFSVQQCVGNLVAKVMLEVAMGGTSVSDKDKTGKFLGIPYDWRKPTRERLKRGVWNPQERRVFVPKVYGWGYGINLWEVARRLGLVEDSRREQ